MKIFIVRNGGIGSNVAVLGHYDEQINLLEETLKEVHQKICQVDKFFEMTISVVTNAEAEQTLTQSGGVNTAVFYITKSMLPVAKKMAKKFPSARIILTTASLPFEEVCLLSKYILTNVDAILSFLLR